MTKWRPLVLAIIAALSALGILPQGLKEVVEANADAVVAGVLGLWAIVAWLRNRKEKQTALGRVP